MLIVSVAASGAFLRIVTVQRSWKDAYNRQLTRADVANLTSANDKIALQKLAALLEKVRGESLAHQKALGDEKTARAADNATSAQKLAVLEGKFDVLNANLTKLQTDLASSLAMKAQLLAEKTALAKSLDLANEANRALKKDFDEASVQIRRLDTTLKHYALLIKDLRAENKELQSEIALLRSKVPTGVAGTGGGDTAPAPVTAPGQAVSGKVTAVHDGVASINIGRAKGIKEKMKLKVFRGGKFVAHLRIDLVEPDSAAGVILNKKLDVVQGDEVATDLK